MNHNELCNKSVKFTFNQKNQLYWMTTCLFMLLIDSIYLSFSIHLLLIHQLFFTPWFQCSRCFTIYHRGTYSVAKFSDQNLGDDRKYPIGRQVNAPIYCVLLFTHLNSLFFLNRHQKRNKLLNMAQLGGKPWSGNTYLTKWPKYITNLNKTNANNIQNETQTSHLNYYLYGN